MKGQALFLWTCFIVLPALAQENASISTGNEFYKRGQYDQAEKHYRDALNSKPKSVNARTNLGNALYKQKKYADAIAAYEQVSANAPDKLKAAAYYNAGVTYTRQDNLPECIEAFKNALRITPDDRQARENLQKALLQLKNQQDQQKKNDEEKKKNPSSMSQSEAERRLQLLEDKEKALMEKLNQKGQGGGRGKDW
jgi:tetratricopeptide (TPR) repeat protein